MVYAASSELVIRVLGDHWSFHLLRKMARFQRQVGPGAHEHLALSECPHGYRHLTGVLWMVGLQHDGILCDSLVSFSIDSVNVYSDISVKATNKLISTTLFRHLCASSRWPSVGSP